MTPKVNGETGKSDKQKLIAAENNTLRQALLRFNNERKLDASASSLLKQIETLDLSDQGPASGLDKYIDRVVSVCTAHAIDELTGTAVADAAFVVAATIHGVVHAGADYSAKFLSDLQYRFAGSLDSAIDFGSDIDVFSVVEDAFEEGRCNPRTDLLEIIAAVKSDAALAAAEADQRKTGPTHLERMVSKVEEACAATEDDAGALFQNHILQAALDIRELSAPAHQRSRARLRQVLGSAGLKEWDKALRKLEAELSIARRISDQADKLRTAAKNATNRRLDDAVTEDEANSEELSDLSPLAYATSADFDPKNDYMSSEFHRLMNRDYGCVPIEGATRYVEAANVTIRTAEDMKQLFEPVRLLVPGKAQPINGFIAWSQWRGRNTYLGVGFYPDGKPPTGYFNLWRGYRVTPKQGEWPLLHQHILQVYCGGNEALADWLFDWLAQLFQDPTTKPGSSLVLRSSAEGVGKSLLINSVLAPILGKAVLSASRSDQLSGRFNSHLQDNLVVAAEEASFAGSKAADGTLKDLITCTDMAYERKGLPIVSGRNFTRVIFISNKEWVVRADATSRRYAVFSCENPQAGNPDYFRPLFDELANGAVEAFFHDMLKREIKSDLRNPPITEALLAQREQSLDGFGNWALSIARHAQIAIPGDSAEIIELDADVNHEVAVTFDRLKASVKAYLDPYEIKAIDHKLGALLKAIGARKIRGALATSKNLDGTKSGSRPWMYELPVLAELRAAVEKHLGVEIGNEAEAAQSEVAEVGDVIHLNARRPLSKLQRGAAA